MKKNEKFEIAYAKERIVKIKIKPSEIFYFRGGGWVRNSLNFLSFDGFFILT